MLLSTGSGSSEKTGWLRGLLSSGTLIICHKKAAGKGEPLPIAIVIGIDPVTLFAISTRVPEGKEYNYAAALAGEPLEVIELENGIKVPHAEIVLEGYIHPTELVDEGPFVDISGTYDHCQEAACDLYHKNIAQARSYIPCAYSCRE